MFFRREKPHKWTFDERVHGLKQHGFTITALTTGSATVSKLGCSATLKDTGGEHLEIGKAGIAVGDEIGLLVDGGYQKYFVTPSGKRIPALAQHLRALHDFQEDLKEGLGLVSLYNQALGTTSDLHQYDRVLDRDRGVPRRPWEP